MNVEWVRLAVDAAGALAWPLVVLLLAMRFVGTFQAELAKFIGKLSRIETPLGSAEVQQGTPSGRQPPLAESEKREIDADWAKLEAELDRRTEEAADVDDVLHVLSQLASSLRERLAAKEREAEEWWLRYLACFLTPHSKRALALIARHPEGIAFGTLGELIGANASAPAEVLSALLGENLVRAQAGSRAAYVVTPAGERFLAYERGFSGTHAPRV
jgi:hypothetical protein